MLDITSLYTVVTDILQVTRNANVVVGNTILVFFVDYNTVILKNLTLNINYNLQMYHIQ